MTSAIDLSVTLFDAVTDIIRKGLQHLVIPPSYYHGLLPDNHIITLAALEDFIAKGQFKTLPDLAPALSYTIILSLIRYVLHHFTFKPLAMRCMSLSEVPLVRVADLDRSFPVTTKSANLQSIRSYCEKTGSKPYDVKKYLWTRNRNMVTNRRIVKFVEALWRFIFYSLFCVVGYYALFVPETVIWMKDTAHYFLDWPSHELLPAVDFYYQIELGCYIHQLLWTEVSRSDAVEMIVHHIVTILLIVFSYHTNFTRFGATILFLHDISDVFLEFAKVLNYTSKGRGNRWIKQYSVVDALFVLFAVTFLVTRLYMYPKYILWTVVVHGIDKYGCDFLGCYVFIGLLTALQLLHIFWFYLIMRMVIKLMSTGIQEDERSDAEDEDISNEFNEGEFERTASLKDDDDKKKKKDK